MPEIKNTFLKGKMNKDLDERLIPNGEYRDALNVEVFTAEGSNIGTVKNILGNHRVESLVVGGNQFTCVGSISNEKSNKLYWFITSYSKDMILEYDTVNEIALPVVVDKKAGTLNAVLKFSGNIITGINVIDNLLFWTDNNSEPKKINIDICKAGTNPNGNVHTTLSFEKGSFDGMTIEHVINSENLSVTATAEDYTFDFENNKSGAFFIPQRRRLAKLLGIPYDDFVDEYGNIVHANTDSIDIDLVGTGYGLTVRHYRNNKFLGLKQISVKDNALGLYATMDPDNFPPNYQVSNEDWYVGDVIFGDNINVEIEERHVTVIRPKPLDVLSFKINHSENSNSKFNIPNLFETKFPRFSYRYKFLDGEYSVFAPFTDVVFNPKYVKDTTNSNNSNILYNKDNAYDIKEPHNKAMVNSIHSVELTDFVTIQTPEDVAEIELLYKQEESPVIYSIGTIKRGDKEWHSWSNNEGSNIGIGHQFDENIDNPKSYVYAADGGYNQGKYIVNTENIYAALPANQLLRPWDNVPKKALAQEVTGNRIVYGNYVQNYDLTNSVSVSVAYDDRKNKFNNFDIKGLPSIKSQRNYQVGVVYCDKYGRETPVFTSTDAAITVPWQDQNGDKNASKSLQLNVSTPTNFPEWVDSLKFFIKENSNEYYNLVMDRAWVINTTDSTDNSENHIWLSFPSSDRNKVSEEDYIILKKKIGTGEEQVDYQNKFKIIDIANEAPDVIKYKYNNLGVAHNKDATLYQAANTMTSTHSTYPGIFKSAGDYQPNIAGATMLQVHRNSWRTGHANSYNAGGLKADLLETNVDSKHGLKENLYVSWRNRDTGVGSKKYKVSSGIFDSGYYKLKLATPISEKDANIAKKDGNFASSQIATHAQRYLHAKLDFKIEQRELSTDDFSGRFFVKISKNQVTDLIESGNIKNILDQSYVSSAASLFFLRDDIGDSADAASTDYGLNNYEGDLGHSGYIFHSSSINGWGDASGDGVANGLKVTDFAEVWKNLRDSEHGPTFFVDALHMAAGQSDASDNAKYSCITWSGCTKNDDEATSEESAWSYPPLKKWLSDFNNLTNILTSGVEIPIGSIYYNEELISTSPGLPNNNKYNNLKVDGWVGPLQNVERDNSDNLTTVNDNSVNGLEGFVTTSLKHSRGPRRWFSGITSSSTEHGVGFNTNTYAEDENDINRHFMHLSFFAPGKDLHDGNFDLDLTSATSIVYGEKSFAANLQGIWGGGVFTGEEKFDTFGTNVNPEERFLHFPMEGNYDENDNYLSEAPGPGVGYGYNIKHKELYERQWDPTFNKNGDEDNKIRDFIRNLYPGAKFRFHRTRTVDSTTAVVDLVDDTVYTIKKVQVKKLYNHTSWRKPYNRYISGTTGALGVDYGYVHLDGQNEIYQSVEQVALRWLDTVEGVSAGQLGTASLLGYDASGVLNSGLTRKIKEFGASHNRRVCYIIELDKNPADSTSSLGNPINAQTKLGNGTGAPGDCMSAQHQLNEFCDVEFLNPIEDFILSDLSKFPAIWELDPKKQEVDLDIYYEASNNIPIKLSPTTNELFAPLGCRVEVLNSTISSSSILKSWNNNEAIFHPGFPKGSAGVEINYSGMSFKFIRQDGSYTIAEAGQQDLDGGSTGRKTNFVFREEIGDVISAGLSWNNCFSFGNGVESNRIRDDFNEPFITNGVKASTITQETYRQERRKNGLIYSGIYNSDGGVNDLNQFIMAEKITKDLNPTYGSVQRLYSRNTDLVTFCEDKVIKVLANKDALFNADGNPQLVANQNVLGQTIPFVGEYGIATNPESFSSESYRAYFTDKQRGAVLRLSKDGLTPISKVGMNDWFKDNLREYNHLIGTYDNHKEEYNLTLTNNVNFSENFILDSYLGTGEALEEYALGSLSVVTNPGVFNGSSFNFLYEPLNAPQYDILEYENSNNIFDWSPFTYAAYNFQEQIKIVHHAEIPVGGIKAVIPYSQSTIIITPEVPATPTEYSVTVFMSNAQDPSQAVAVYTEDNNGNPFLSQQDAIDYAVSQGYSAGNVAVAPIITNNEQAEYEEAQNLPDNGWWYDPRFTSVSGDLFGSNATGLADTNVFSRIKRFVNGISLNEPNYNAPFVEDRIVYPNKSSYGGYLPDSITQIAQCITRHDGQDNYGDYDVDNGTAGAITFYRANPANSYVEFKDIGNQTYPGRGVLQTYYDNGGNVGIQGHKAFYAGDEIHIQFELTIFKTAIDEYNAGAAHYGRKSTLGYNYIIPRIQLFDGTNLINSNILQAGSVDNINSTSHYYGANTSPNNMGSDFQTVNYPAYLTPDMYEQNDNNDGFKCVKRVFSTSSTVDFPDTFDDGSWIGSTLNNPAKATSSFQNNNLPSMTQGLTADEYLSSSFPAFGQVDGYGTHKVTCGVSFKFKDPGGYPNAANATGGITEIEEVKVVNNLRIRISNAKPASTEYNGTSPNTSQYKASEFDGDENIVGYSSSSTETFINPLNYQLWQINKLLVKKGYGVTKPHVDFTITPQDDIVTTVTTGVAVPGTPYEPAQTDITSVAAVPPIPAVKVDAWTEVLHNAGSSFPWNIDVNAWGTGTGGNTYRTQAQEPNVCGGNYGKVLVTEYGQSLTNVSQLDQSNPIQYYRPSTAPAGGSPYGTLGAASGSPVGVYYNRTYMSHVGYNAVYPSNHSEAINYSNEYIYVQNNTVAPVNAPANEQYGALDIEYNISGNPWEIDTWYLVDIEWDESHNPDAGQFYSGGDGILRLWGVLENDLTYGGFSAGDDLSISPSYGESWVGKFSGGHGIALVPVTRTEYGTQRTVLRAIFKIQTNSEVLANTINENKFTLRAVGILNGIKINKIITKKLNGGISNSSIWTSWLNTSGTADQWTVSSIDSSGFPEDINHAFQGKRVYYKGGYLNWEVPASATSGLHHWSQDFNTLQTQDAPVVSAVGWNLSFTVNTNQKTGNAFSGNLEGFVAITDTGATNNVEGIYFTDVQHVGQYLIKFNFDGDDTNWEFLRGELGANVNTFTDYTSTGSIEAVSNVSSLTATDANKITIREKAGQTVAQEYGISDIQLTDAQQVFLGGSAGSWNFNGFNTSLNDYIYWGSDPSQLNIVLFNCPAVGSYGNSVGFISASQLITKTIKQFEKYRISFTHTITPDSTATLSVYYYNSDGYGFKISNINSFTGVNGFVEQVVTIGELDSTGNPVAGSKWSNTNQFNPIYTSDLKNSFVFSIEGLPDDIIDGTIDNITMQRVFTDSMFEDKTVSFNETVNGWTSFKSFVPENGLSVSKKYFTFDEGCLYQHHVPLDKGNNAYGIDNNTGAKIYVKPEEAVNYNIFYKDPFEISTVTAVFNQEPSVIKTFNTLNYEGSQARIRVPYASQSKNTITLNNAIATYTPGGVRGWECTAIKTDLEVGTVEEFVKKEGKWFNYIKGTIEDQTKNIDTSLFSVQGLGFIESIEVADSVEELSTYVDPFSSGVSPVDNTSPNASVATGGATSSGGAVSSGVGVRYLPTGGGGY